MNRLLSNDIYTSIYLIDNNSTDNSHEIAKNLAGKYEKIELFKTGKNKGKGSALAFSKNLIHTSHVVIHDADLEYFPEDIIEMFELAKQNQNSLILGSRFIGSKKKRKYLPENIFGKQSHVIIFFISKFL